MTNEVSISRHLEYQDFFPSKQAQSKENYAAHAGKELIETFSFSEFVREYGYTIGITLNINTLETLYKKCGIK